MAGPARRPHFQPRNADPCFCGSGRVFSACCGTASEPREPPYQVQVVRQFLSPAECRDMVRLAESLPRKPVQVLDAENSTPGHTVWKDDPRRITHSVQLREHQSILREWVERATRRYLQPFFGRAFSWYEDPRLLRYQAGGKYEVHADADNLSADGRGWEKVLDRDASLLIYLNDDFIGGRLHFHWFRYFYTPVAGDLVFFPSDMRYAHAAETLRSGVRYAVVSWMALAGVPRVRPVPPPEAVPFGTQPGAPGLDPQG